MSIAQRHHRGAALLLVLWLVAALIAIVLAIAARSRMEHLQASVARQQVQSLGAAQAGVEWAVGRLNLPPGQGRLPVAGQEIALPWEGYTLRIAVQDETGKLDLNAVPAELLRDLMVELEVDAVRAETVAGAILDFRDGDDLLQPVGGAEDGEYERAGLPYGAKDRNFEHMGELRQVLGMDEDLFQRLRPYLTLYSGSARPDPEYAAEPVLRALRVNPLQIAEALRRRELHASQLSGAEAAGIGAAPADLAAPGSGTYDIHVRVERGDRVTTALHATLRVKAAGAGGRMYDLLEWRDGDGD